MEPYSRVHHDISIFGWSVRHNIDISDCGAPTNMAKTKRTKRVCDNLTPRTSRYHDQLRDVEGSAESGQLRDVEGSAESGADDSSVASSVASDKALQGGTPNSAGSSASQRADRARRREERRAAESAESAESALAGLREQFDTIAEEEEDIAEEEEDSGETIEYCYIRTPAHICTDDSYYLSERRSNIPISERRSNIVYIGTTIEYCLYRNDDRILSISEEPSTRKRSPDHRDVKEMDEDERRRHVAGVRRVRNRLLKKNAEKDYSEAVSDEDSLAELSPKKRGRKLGEKFAQQLAGHKRSAVAPNGKKTDDGGYDTDFTFHTSSSEREARKADVNPGPTQELIDSVASASETSRLGETIEYCYIRTPAHICTDDSYYLSERRSNIPISERRSNILYIGTTIEYCLYRNDDRILSISRRRSNISISERRSNILYIGRALDNNNFE